MFFFQTNRGGPTQSSISTQFWDWGLVSSSRWIYQTSSFSPTILLQKQCQKKNLFFRDQIRSGEVLVIVRIYIYTYTYFCYFSRNSCGSKCQKRRNKNQSLSERAQVNQNPKIAMTFRLNLQIHRSVIIIWVCLEMGVILPN